MKQVVWDATVDGGKWEVKVVREANYTGRLTVVRASDGLVVLDKSVGLTYMAIFGPDVDDVAQWQEWSLNAIDEHLAESSNED